MALVASVFSRKMRCSLSPQRSTSDIIRSVRKSWGGRQPVGRTLGLHACYLSSGQEPLLPKAEGVLISEHRPPWGLPEGRAA